MSRAKGKLSKAIREEPRQKQILIARFGELAVKNPEACLFAYKLLWAFAILKEPHYNGGKRRIPLEDAVARTKDLEETAFELLLKCKEGFFARNAAFLQDLATAVEILASGDVDPARTIILDLPKMAKAAGIPWTDERTVQDYKVVMTKAGLLPGDKENRQLRRMLNECGIDYLKGKAGRKSGQF